MDNIRAVNELPIKNTIVLNVFEYYTMEYATQQIQFSPQIDDIGKVSMSNITCNNIACNLAVYNDGIINHYAPELQSGSWLSDYSTLGDGTIPAVVSDNLRLKVGNTTEIYLSNEKEYRIAVVGILKKPTQYLYPSGAASPEFFTAKSVISQEPVIIIPDIDFGDTSVFEPPIGLSIPKVLFIFLKSNVTDVDINSVMKDWNKYGEVTPMALLISTYNKETNRMISSGLILFIVFLSLAATSVLSNNVIQNIRNRKLFTVYYLLGMNWRKGAVIEICRVSVIIIITMALSLIAGRFGLLMLQWMTPMRAFIFYGFVFLYNVVMFTTVGAGFLIKLIREDISETLKDLHQGE